MGSLYIITGANGHLGNVITRQLVDDGKSVRALVLKGDNAKSLKGVNCEIFYGNVCDKGSLKEIFDVSNGVDIILIHCAGIVSIASKYVQKVYDVNVGGTKNIVDIAIEKKISKLIHVSSVHAIPENKNGELIREVTNFDKDNVEGLYAKTKSEATQYVLKKAKEGLNACVVHPSGIIGPYDFFSGHLTQLVIDYLNGRLTACIHGGYDFVDVRDVSDGILSAVEKGKRGECYILSNTHVEVPDLLNMLSNATNKKRIKTILPMWFANFTAPIAEVYYKLLKQPPLYTRYSLYTLYSNSNFSHEKATKELDYNPREIAETLKDTAFWLQKQGRVKF